MIVSPIISLALLILTTLFRALASTALCLSTTYRRTIFFSMLRPPPRSTLFPTRRSSDLRRWPSCPRTRRRSPRTRRPGPRRRDRKSTRLNSSHANISYAVFCLKKKNQATLVGGGIEANDGVTYASLLEPNRGQRAAHAKA